MTRPASTTSTVIPGLRYRDATRAIDWLCRAFGFEKHLVVPGEQEGEIAHAQLTFGNGMIILGSADTHGGGYDELVRPPAARTPARGCPLAVRVAQAASPRTRRILVRAPDAETARGRALEETGGGSAVVDVAPVRGA